MSAPPLTPLMIRYWDTYNLINLPLSQNYRVDNFGNYLNILPVSDGSLHYSLWFFLDQKEDKMIDSYDNGVFLQEDINISAEMEAIDISFTDTEFQSLVPISLKGDGPSEEGVYYCFFKPQNVQGDSILLIDGVSFNDYRPFASWEKKSVPSAQPLKFKEAYLPASASVNTFTGICILDRNKNEQFNQDEPTFKVPMFQILPDDTNFFTISGF